MSPQAVQSPALDVLSASEEAVRDAINAAFAAATAVMEQNGITPEGITFEYVSHAVDRLWEHEEDLVHVRFSANALVSRYIVGLRHALGEAAPTAAPAGPQSTAGEPTVSNEDVRFITRLAADMAMSQARVTGNLQVSGANAVRQAIGLMQDARRQLLQVQSGEIAISDPTEGGRDAA